MRRAAPRLGVNIDHIASVRQLRRGQFPDPSAAARTCELAGAESIVCHLREDRRHIQDKDVRVLRQSIRTSLNLEMSIDSKIVDFALKVMPEQVTLVPERREELTTEGGLDVRRLTRHLQPIVRRFLRQGIRVSLFVDPSPIQLHASALLGIPMVELHTGKYANVTTAAGRQRQLQVLRRAAKEANRRGLRVAVGHGLDYDNVAPVAAIPEVEELNIGYSIIVRSLTVGLDRAVREMVGVIEKAHARTAS